MDVNQSFANAPVAQPAPDSLELSGLGKYTTMLGQVQAEQQRQQAVPFNQANLAGLTSNLNRVQTQNNEYMGQPATDARMAGYKNTQVQAEQDAAQAPLNTQILQQKARLAPVATDADIAEATEKIRKLKEAPRKEVVDKMASQYDDIAKETNPILQAKKLQEITDGHLATITDPELKEQIRKQFTGPQALEHLRTARNESINTAAHIQKLEEEKTKGQFEVESARIHAGGEIGAAQIHAKSAEKIAEMAAAAPKTQAAMIGKARRTIMDPAASELDKGVALEIVKAATEADVQKELTARQLELIQGKTTVEDIRAQHYKNAGIYGSLVPNSTPNPASTPPANQQPAGRLPPNVKNIQDVRGMDPRYKDIPENQLRAAVKQKYGVDLQ